MKSVALSPAQPGNSIRYRILPEHGTILLQLIGNLTVDEIVNGMRAVMADPDYSLRFTTLADNRELTSAFTSLVSRQLIELASVMRHGISTRAAVLTGGVLQAKMINVINLFTRDDVQVRGFIDVAEALAWLHTDPEASGVVTSILNGPVCVVGGDLTRKAS